LALRLPRQVADGVGLSEGATVDLRVERGHLVVVPARPRYELKELLRQMKPTRRHREVEWGGARGAEEW
jgi:antitoxin component of MazEF toxin-antitoxin module